MNKETFLDTVKATVADRGHTYGPPGADHKRVADYWSLHLRNTYGTDCELTALDVQIMVMQLKMVRLEKTPDHMDSIIDIAGYAACAAECAEQQKSVFSYTPSTPVRTPTSAFAAGVEAADDGLAVND